MSDRTTLAARQAEVLDALLAGVVPAGFDPLTTAAAGRQLRAKRRLMAAHAVPSIEQVHEFRKRFDAYAVAHREHGCPHADAYAFLASLPDLLPGPYAALRTEQVYAGTRRLALIREAGRRVLLVRAGKSVFHLAVSAPKEPSR